MKGPVRLHAPFAVWSRAADNGTAPQLREWLEEASDKVWERMQPHVRELMTYGSVVAGQSIPE